MTALGCRWLIPNGIEIRRNMAISEMAVQTAAASTGACRVSRPALFALIWFWLFTCRPERLRGHKQLALTHMRMRDIVATGQRIFDPKRHDTHQGCIGCPAAPALEPALLMTTLKTRTITVGDPNSECKLLTRGENVLCNGNI